MPLQLFSPSRKYISLVYKTITISIELFIMLFLCHHLFLRMMPCTLKINKLQRKLGGKEHKNEKKYI